MNICLNQAVQIVTYRLLLLHPWVKRHPQRDGYMDHNLPEVRIKLVRDTRYQD